MNEVNKTLFIPLYGRAMTSKKGIIINDKKAEEIWAEESFEIKGKSKSKWLAYNMAMRARVFDDWTNNMLRTANEDTIVIHIGCGLDSRYLRVSEKYHKWIDCDLQEVIDVRKKYYDRTERYCMLDLDASNTDDIKLLPNADRAVIIMEGISMYLTKERLVNLLKLLEGKYNVLHILIDVYTEFGAKASRYKNPVKDVGVQTLNGVDDIDKLLLNTKLKVIKEHSFTPEYLVNELKGFERVFFKLMFTGRLYSKIYRLYELG
ncbi:class I SAM-dependent methyltransferase [Bacteroides heparinolyticus]|uniref:class I SAM-dependent methyltransferase n=1 Tax=Prevotella heparinolytica TaxID=28113 RepID=UPI0035A147DF